MRRVGSSGGGRTYRKQRPVNFYGILAVIVVVGLLAVTWARYDYQHPAGAASQSPPTVGTQWFAALGVSICGDQHAELAPDPDATGGFNVLENNVIEVAPLTAAETGANATLSKLLVGYGIVATKAELYLPASGSTEKPTIYTAGEKCPKGTKDAGRPGQIEIATWKNVLVNPNKPTLTTNAASVRFTPNMLISIGFEPKGVVPLRPSETAIAAMLSSTPSTTTTTLPAATTTTTLPATTTTTAKG